MEKWQTSAADIDLDMINSMLYKNQSVEDFLNNKKFIIAEKGIGKTLLLKKKRLDLSKNSVQFIPSNRPFLDIPDDFIDLNKNIISYLEEQKNTTQLWTASIQLSAIKNFCDKTAVEHSNFGNGFSMIFTSSEFSNPSEIFLYIVTNFSISDISQYLKCSRQYLNHYYSEIKSKLYIFIDRLDQAMRLDKTDCTLKMWIAMQTGLIEAAWNLMEKNSHIEIFCSIRKEAYEQYESPIKSNLYGCVCELNYSNNELHELINVLCNFYEKCTIEDMVHIGTMGKFKHPKTGNEETVFDYILRHTVSKPRDLVIISSQLKKTFNNSIINKEETLRNVVNNSATNISKNIFTENERFLECLCDKRERENFLSSIPKNILTKRELMAICSNFNNKHNYSDEKCNKCNGKHPFCELYNIGLLGYVTSDRPFTQKFKEPYDYTTTKRITQLYGYYIIHPCLCDTIRQARTNIQSKDYIVIPGITTGNNIEWKDSYPPIIHLVSDIQNSNLIFEDKLAVLSKLKDEIYQGKDIDSLRKDIQNILGHTQSTSKRLPKQKLSINVLIASPSDFKTRKYLINEFANYFNRKNQFTICVYGYEHFYPKWGQPQNIINDKIGESIDIVIAFFKGKVGSPVIDENGEERSISGTVEELLLPDKINIVSMAYFCSNPPIDANDKKSLQDRIDLLNFKDSIKNKIFYKEFNIDDKDHIFSLLSDDLTACINELFL